MITLGIFAIVFGLILFTKAFIDSDYDMLTIILAFYGGMFVSFGILYIASTKSPKAIDVYRGKTTLQITYRDNVPTDTTVIYK